MLPAAAEGELLVVGRDNEADVLAACKKINDSETAICTRIERSFLRGLLGGCSTPVSAYARITGNKVHFEGNIFSPDGTKKVEIARTVLTTDSDDLGHRCAEEVLENGGREINVLIREQMKKSPTA